MLPLMMMKTVGISLTWMVVDLIISIFNTKEYNLMLLGKRPTCRMQKAHVEHMFKQNRSTFSTCVVIVYIDKVFLNSTLPGKCKQKQ